MKPSDAELIDRLQRLHDTMSPARTVLIDNGDGTATGENQKETIAFALETLQRRAAPASVPAEEVLVQLQGYLDTATQDSKWQRVLSDAMTLIRQAAAYGREQAQQVVCKRCRDHGVVISTPVDFTLTFPSMPCPDCKGAAK